jgi:DNA-directed RNA polymerase specialized sigma24 family protein
MSKSRTRTGPDATAASPAPAAPKAKPRRARKAVTVPEPLTREQSAQRLVAALGDQLGSLCAVIERVGDAGIDVDAVLAHLAALASRPRRPARKGQERAWLLSALLRLLGASAAEPDPRRLPLLRRLKPSPGTIEVRPERLQRLQDALQNISAPERASVVLVVQEGLSLEQASRVLGHSRQEFVEAYSEAIDALDDDMLEALMGHG